ncbi:uncharacterized protein NECHADRAFT_87755 [Fusarium vanettenii 77-13-4]|uniref:Uncharacterized protein n=1 Tax=Fusarium vanettenii (strain ATCC MYA-4622 / CBS 123669 / FGSC 9596 / NRRL 45880 / 77-13-4) TaxID=660122 RepID=C7Z2Y0_FUSV7|nr:uncharacterized protein NECHADRAFT_87755 [Fusarium vanettenii 77-13-4]EEU41562.1 hypothetical protein NECHADRAFT_87755 [Fusarium vanettenii 77-13-4]
MDSRESSVETADSSDYVKAMMRLEKICKYSERHYRNLRSVESPLKRQDENFKRDQAKLNDLNLEFREVASDHKLPDGITEDAKPDWLMDQVLAIQQLKKRIEMGPDRESVENEEAEYQAHCRSEERLYFFALLKLFGDRGRAWTMEFYGLNDRITATDMATPRSMASTPSPGNDEAGDEWDVPDDREDPTPLTPHPRTHLDKRAAARKRRITKSAERPGQQKRPRHNSTRGSLAGDRTIEFDQVFQDGKTRTKYRIARYPPRNGAWYILECRQHDKHFPKDPVHGAAKHLDSPAHQHMGRGHEQAVRELGIRVLGCNEVLAARNNAVFDRASVKDARNPDGRRLPSSGARKSHFRIPQPRNIDKIMKEINPGDVCVTRWQNHRGLYPIYILPLGKSLRMRFMQSAILETDLVNQLPSCFEFDPETDEIPRWAPGFEDGGNKVHQRLYPVMFFRSSRFPQGNEISFVPGSHMKPYDKNDPTIRYRDQVEDFLTRRHNPTPPPEAASRSTSPTSSSTPSSDDAIRENATPRQRLSPHPEIQRLLEWSSADFGEHAVVEQHETDEHDDYPHDPRTADADDEEEEGVGNSTYHFRDRRRRRRFNDRETEEEATESEEEEDDGIRGDEEDEDIYGDDTLGRPLANRSRDTSNTPASNASDIPNIRFPTINEFWRQQSRERTAESDKQSSYSELFPVGLQMS